MKRMIAGILSAMMVAGAFTGCTQQGQTASAAASAVQQPSESVISEPDPESEAEDEAEAEEEVYEYYNENYHPGFVYNTSDIVDYKREAAEQQGTVETLEYETPAYAVNAVLGTDYTITKKLNIYLPYGYDPEKDYNILYLMHGGGDDQDYWLTDFSDRTHGETTRNVLDHMIEDGLCDPMIIVTPTFYSSVEGVEVTEEQCSAIINELGEENYTKIDDLYTWYFQYELRDQIIPLVESTYSTYAQNDVSEENLIATRDHRAYAGL